MQELNLGGN